MGKPDEPYILIVVETYLESGSGLHGDLHVRPIAGQALPRNLRVRFPKWLRRAHPLGTRFLVYAKLTDKEGGNDFVHTNHAWDVQVLGPPPAGDDLKYKKWIQGINSVFRNKSPNRDNMALKPYAFYAI